MLKLNSQLNLLVPPIAFFAANGLVVIFFKIFKLNIQLFLPVILSVTAVTLMASFFKLKSEPQLQKLLFVAKIHSSDYLFQRMIKCFRLQTHYKRQ